MKRLWMLLMVCLMCMMIPMGAQANLDLSSFEAFKEQAMAENYFKIWIDAEDNEAYAQWERNNDKDYSFRVKMENFFSSRTVDACTFEIRAMDVYEEPIRLRADDNEYYSSLYYTSERTHKPGTTGYTEYFRLKADQKIRYIAVTLIKFHTDLATHEVPESSRKEFIWKIK